MSNEAKLVRKQLRTIAQELLPELLKAELQSAMYKELTDQIHVRLDKITQTVKDTLNQIDERSKDIQSFAVRQSGVVSVPLDTASGVSSNEQA